MNVDWNHFGNYLYGNKVAILAFCTLFFTSGIKTMPPPGTPFSKREWFYDWTHQFFNITNNRLASFAIPQPPLAAAAPLPVPVEETVARPKPKA